MKFLQHPNIARRSNMHKKYLLRTICKLNEKEIQSALEQADAPKSACRSSEEGTSVGGLTIP